MNIAASTEVDTEGYYTRKRTALRSFKNLLKSPLETNDRGGVAVKAGLEGNCPREMGLKLLAQHIKVSLPAIHCQIISIKGAKIRWNRRIHFLLLFYNYFTCTFLWIHGQHR